MKKFKAALTLSRYSFWIFLASVLTLKFLKKRIKK